MPEEKNPFLGTGWGFPPTFIREKAGVVMTSDEEDINRSLQILFSTNLGERVMQPLYGSDLGRFLFEPIDTTMKTYMRELIREAILYFEPRIRLIDLDLLPLENEGRIDITLIYEIKGTNSRFNFIYPYYQKEGTDINR